MRRAFIDASTFITLAEIGKIELLRGIAEIPVLPQAVVEEIGSGVAASVLSEALDDWATTFPIDSHAEMRNEIADARKDAGNHLGVQESTRTESGDHALLTLAIYFGLRAEETIVVITDDKPLRKTCNALGIPISGSIGVVIAAVERGELDQDEAKAALVAMDEIGARLSARLLREAERLIDVAATVREE